MDVTRTHKVMAYNSKTRLIASELLRLSGPTLEQQPSSSHHGEEAVAGYAYIQLWLTNRISFESCSSRQLAKRKFTLPAHEGLTQRRTINNFKTEASQITQNLSTEQHAREKDA